MLYIYIFCYRNIFPENIIQAGFAHVRTSYKNETKYRKVATKVLKSDLEALNITANDVNNTLALLLNNKVKNLTMHNMTDENTNYTLVTMKVPYNATVKSIPYNDGINVLGMNKYRLIFTLPVFSATINIRKIFTSIFP